MSTEKLANITIAEFEAFLELCLCKFIQNKKGHAKYTRSDLNRPITFQNHIKIIPEFIVQNNIRLLGINKKDYYPILRGEKLVVKEGDNFNIEDKK